MFAESAESPVLCGSQQTHVDALVAELAGRQYGVVSRGQLEGLGVGRRAVEWRIGAGRLHRLHPGVYAVGHSLIPKEGRWLAAVLASGTDAVLSHQAAAALWGMRPYVAGAIDITTPRKWRSAEGIRRHCSHLRPDEVMTVGGIRVTGVSRTILDLAGSSSAHTAESALREAEYLRLFDSLSLPVLLDRYPGRRGVRAIRLALARHAESPGRTRSRLEERFLPFLDHHRLPRPRLNVWIEVEGERYQVDCFWREQNVIVELDGWQRHGTSRAFRQDRTRDRRLRVAGYGVTRITWSHLDDEPEAIASDLRRLLGTGWTRGIGSRGDTVNRRQYNRM